MNISPAKENILKRIRKALINTTPQPFPRSEGIDAVVALPQQELDIEFAEQFSKLGGRFVFCETRQQLSIQLQALVEKMGWQHIFSLDSEIVKNLGSTIASITQAQNLNDCDASITGCEYLVARTGSILLSTAQPGGRGTSVYAPIHICVAYTSQLVPDIKDALIAMRERFGENFPSLVTLASGPSRTADIEKTLVVGVHGPKEVYVFLVQEA